MARRESLKKFAKIIQSKGRFGDTELAHINKDEEKLLERYRGGKLSKNPKTGVKEAFPWLAAASAGQAIYGAYTDKLAADKQIKARQQSIKAASKVQPAEASAMARLRKGAKEGTMDVEKLNMQMSQPLYQQGEAQEAQAMGKMTQQGLEGTIVAQEVSRKIGSDVRADIAGQARKIALENERTKADADRRLQQALFARGAKLRELAMQKAELSTASDVANIGMWKDIGQAGLGFAGAVGEEYLGPPDWKSAGFKDETTYDAYQKQKREAELEAIRKGKVIGQ